MSAALALGMQSCFNYKTYKDSFVGRVQSTELQGLKEAGYPHLGIWEGTIRGLFVGILSIWGLATSRKLHVEGPLEWKVSRQPSPYIHP